MKTEEFLFLGTLCLYILESVSGLVSQGPRVQIIQHPPLFYKPVAERSSTCLWLNHGDESDDAGCHSSDFTRHVPTREKFRTWSTSELLQELDRRDIRYAPTSTRAALLNLLLENDDSRTEEKDTTISVGDLEKPKSNVTSLNATSSVEDFVHQSTENATFASRRHSSLHRLLEELNRRDIRFSPKASRAELEALLRESSKMSTDRNQYATVTKDVPASMKSPTATRPIREILAELDSRDIRYAPTATRKDLEELLRIHKGSNTVSVPLEEDENNRRRRHRRERRQRSQRLMEAEAPVKSFLFKSTKLASKLPRKVIKLADNADFPSRLSKVAERAARQARRVKRRTSDIWNEDEDEIRDADWKYVSKHTPINVEALPLEEERKESRASRVPRSPTHPKHRKRRVPHYDERPYSWEERGNVTPPRRPRAASQPTRRTPRQTNAPRKTRSFTRERLPLANPLQLPSASPFPDLNYTSSHQNEKDQHRQSRDRHRRRIRDTSKRIYSQYEDQGEFDNEYDAFDRFGNFVADSAENFMWGADEDSDQKQIGQKPRANRPPRTTRGRPRHWKDRLSEQLDYALGIHEDGKYYNSWEANINKYKGEEDEGEMEIPESLRRNEPARRKRRTKPSSAFWEDEGNVLSLLFGRTKTGRPLTFDRYLDNTSTTKHLTFFLRSLIKGTLVAASYTCRWASVRGAIPQPVVVVLSSAAFLSSRPKRRLLTFGLTLLAIRTVGELIHGYVHGDQDWEDDDYDQERTEKTVRKE